MPWSAEVARAVDTLVVLMPMGNLEALAAELAGVLGATWPAAVISNATMEAERFVRASLGTIAAACRRGEVTSPATLVVGRVVDAVAIRTSGVSEPTATG